MLLVFYWNYSVNLCIHIRRSNIDRNTKRFWKSHTMVIYGFTVCYHPINFLSISILCRKLVQYGHLASPINSSSHNYNHGHSHGHGNSNNRAESSQSSQPLSQNQSPSFVNDYEKFSISSATESTGLKFPAYYPILWFPPCSHKTNDVSSALFSPAAKNDSLDPDAHIHKVGPSMLFIHYN